VFGAHFKAMSRRAGILKSVSFDNSPTPKLSSPATDAMAQAFVNADAIVCTNQKSEDVYDVPSANGESASLNIHVVNEVLDNIENFLSFTSNDDFAAADVGLTTFNSPG
jgi:hypothetical protein